MDAYSSYILKLSEARTSELRREAVEYALSRAARGDRISLRSRMLARLMRRPPPTVEPVAPVRLAATVQRAELRRTA